MNITKILTIAAALLIVFSSCKKDKKETPEPAPAINYPFLKTGNYVVYETINVDDNGTEHFDKLDSIVIEKDTVINGLKYFKQVNTGGPFASSVSYLRDSAGYLVSVSGGKSNLAEISQAPRLIQTELINGDTLYQLFEYRESHDTAITLPAGSFTANIIVHNLKFQEGKDPNKKYWEKNNYRYTDVKTGITLISKLNWASAGTKSYILQRLVRYKIN
jgi:hypothetical protein